MSKKIFSSLLSISVLALLSSCDKDNDDHQTERERQLVTREWKITDITRKSLVNPNQDSSILKSCTTDDRLVFSANHQFQLKDGAAKCDSTIFQYDAGSWNFNQSQDILKLSGTQKVQNWKVLTLNDSVMRVQWLDSTSAENKVLKTISLKNK